MREAYKMITRMLKRQQRRSTASEPLSVWVIPKKECWEKGRTSPDGKERRRSTSEVVQFLKEVSERESVLRKEDLELRRRELSQKEDMMKMLAQQQQQQTQRMLCLLANGQNKNSQVSAILCIKVLSLNSMFLLLEVLLWKSTEVACMFSRHAIVHCLYLKVHFETANL